MTTVHDGLPELLPGTWAPRLAGTTLVLAAASFGLPSLLPSSYQPSGDEALFLSRLVCVGVVILLGALATLVATAEHERGSTSTNLRVKLEILAVVVAGAGLAFPFVVPACLFPSLPHRTLVLLVASLAVSAALVVALLIVAAVAVKRELKRRNRSFWERER